MGRSEIKKLRKTHWEKDQSSYQIQSLLGQSVRIKKENVADLYIFPKLIKELKIFTLNVY